MKLTTVLFDLDGTLLPMDQELFVKAYLGGLSKAAASYGYEPETMVKGIMMGTGAMVKNTGERTNEEVFWQVMEGLFGPSILEDIHIFDEFYKTDFQKIREVCGFDPLARETVMRIREMGLRVSLATNPLFPSVATESRIRWAGLDPEDFDGFTSYEKSRYCKPNPDYYRDVLKSLGVVAEECLMVGNDVGEDMVARTLGMRVFLLTDCMINRKNEDISAYPHGSYEELLAYVEGEMRGEGDA